MVLVPQSWRTGASPKRAPRPDPEAHAGALLQRFGIRHPREIRVDLLAYECGASVVWRDTGAADARVVCAGDAAYIAIARSAFGTPRARFSIAHELAHRLMHRGDDALERIHGGARKTEHEYRLEREADLFASFLLVPTYLAASFCAASPPTLDAVGDLARRFDVSLTVAAKRWVQLAPTSCAVAETYDGKTIHRAGRSDAWRGIAVGRRDLEEGTLALDMARADSPQPGARVHARAWGSEQAGAPVTEECVPLGDSGAVLTWLWHA